MPAVDIIRASSSSSGYDVTEKNSPIDEKRVELTVESQTVELRKYSHGFWDPELAPQRKMYFTVMGVTVTLLSIIFWTWFILYWGAYQGTDIRTKNLVGWLIDMDGGDLGAAIVNATKQNIAAPTSYKITWEILDKSMFGTYDEIPAAIIDEQAWIAVVVEAGSTDAIVSARENGDATFSGMKFVNLYYNEGRNEVATDDYVVPYATTLVSEGIAMFTIGQTAEYIATQSGNATAMANVVKAPQTLAAPAGFTTHNLRPYSNPVAGALIIPANIWVIIGAFFITAAGWPMRQPIEPFLKTKSLFLFRLAGPAVIYIPISLFFSMINLPFDVPFGSKFSHAGGFFIFWLFEYMNFMALGLAEEAIVTLTGGNYISYFLPGWICINVAVGSVPIVMQQTFYKYGYGFPVYNMAQATRTIIFNTKSHLGLNAGVLIAWIALSCVTIPIFSMFIRKKEQKKDASSVRA